MTKGFAVVAKHALRSLKIMSEARMLEPTVISNRDYGGRSLIHVKGVHLCTPVYSGVELFDMASFNSFLGGFDRQGG
jgi:hypothetical protein